MHPMLTIAVRAARNAGDIIQRSANKVSQLRVNQKSSHDFVSEVDFQAEQEIIHVIKQAYPDHAIMAEESGEHEGNEYLWIIDPLDGTTNFLHGFPQYAVSIGLKHKNKMELGVVYDPVQDELFTAERGGGAMLNNRRIRVSDRNNLQTALLGTGYPFRSEENVDEYLAMFRPLCVATSGIRRAGAAALDLAYVACGRLDGFWEIGLQPWDMAAGVLLIQEAGGVITDFAFNDKYMASGNLMTANPKIHQLMYKTVEPHLADHLKR